MADHHGHGHGHREHHGHSHGAHCDHEHTTTIPRDTKPGPVGEEQAFLKSRTEGGPIRRAINDFKARVFKGEHWHQHGNHAHKYAVPMLGRIAIVGGSAASLGVAIHGLDNMRKGAFGYKDNELNQEYAPSTRRFLVGAGEVAGGLALAKRIGTGQWKL